MRRVLVFLREGLLVRFRLVGLRVLSVGLRVLFVGLLVLTVFRDLVLRVPAERCRVVGPALRLAVWRLLSLTGPSKGMEAPVCSS